MGVGAVRELNRGPAGRSLRDGVGWMGDGEAAGKDAMELISGIGGYGIYLLSRCALDRCRFNRLLRVRGGLAWLA